MERLLLGLAFLTLLMLVTVDSQARDTKHYYPISVALDKPEADEALNPEIKLYFAGQKQPKAKTNLGSFITNKKTNATFRSDENSCNWVLLSALKALQERAVEQGGNAVIDIESYYKKNVYRSSEQFECHAGGVIAGVALRGTVIKY